jgi:hypothetical protein
VSHGHVADRSNRHQNGGVDAGLPQPSCPRGPVLVDNR